MCGRAARWARPSRRYACTLDHSLHGPRAGRRKRCRPVLAYADDVTVFVTLPAEFVNISQAIQCFEKATGAQPNPSKSKDMALGGLTAPTTELGIAFYDSIKVLGVTFGPTIPQTMKYSWTGLKHAVRIQSRKAFTRSLCVRAAIPLRAVVPTC